MASDLSDTEIRDTGMYLVYDGPSGYWSFDHDEMDLTLIDGAIEAYTALRRYTEKQISATELG